MDSRATVRIVAMLVMGAVAIAAIAHGPETVVAVGFVFMMSCAIVTAGSVHPRALKPAPLGASVGVVEIGAVGERAHGEDEEAWEILFEMLGGLVEYVLSPKEHDD